MPRRSLFIPSLFGGLNNARDSKLIENSECSIFKNVKVDTDLTIKLLGEFTSHISPKATDNGISERSSFFAYDVDNSLTSPYDLGNYQVYVITHQDGGDEVVSIIDSAGNEKYTLTLSSHGIEPDVIYQIIRGKLHLQERTFNYSTTPKKFFFVDRTVFDNYTGTYDPSYTQKSWQFTNMWLSAPDYLIDGEFDDIVPDESSSSASTATTFYPQSGTGPTGYIADVINNAASDGYPFGLYHPGQNKNVEISSVNRTTGVITTNSLTTGSWDSQSNCYIIPPLGKGISLAVSYYSDSNETLSGSSYKLGISFLYDTPYQDSPITEGGGLYTPSSGYGITVTAILSGFSEDQTGARIWIRKSTEPGDWRLLGEIDFYRGSRGTIYDVEYDEYNSIDSSGGVIGDVEDSTIYCEFSIADLPIDTYQAINGYMPNDPIEIRYKAIAWYGGYAYYGNVMLDDGTILNDAIYRSALYRPNIVLKYERFEIMPSDGDEITALKVWGDHLLVFKRHKVAIVNIGAAEPYIEAIKHFVGVDHYSRVVETDYGIAWVSDNGLYLFDGNTIIDLFEDTKQPGQYKIDLSWASSLLSNPMLGYSPISKELVVFADSDASDDQDILVFSFRTYTWSHGVGRLDMGDILSNPSVTKDGYLVVYCTSDAIYKWNEDKTTNETYINIKTKSFYLEPQDFDKVFNLVRIMNKSTTSVGSSHKILVRFIDENGNQTFTSNELSTSSDWTLTELHPSNYKHTCKWIALEFYTNTTSSETIPTDFGISSIEIVYRPKGYR